MATSMQALSVDDQDGIVMMSAKGQTVRISMKDLRVMGRTTQGVKLVNLKEDDYLIAVQKIKNDVQEEPEGGANGDVGDVRGG